MADDPALPPIEQKIVQARQSGYSNAQIQTYLSGRYDAALKAGYSQTEVQRYLGFDPAQQQASTAAMAANAKATYQAQPPQPQASDSPLDLFVSGVQASSGGIVAKMKDPSFQPAANAGLFSRLAYSAGTAIGDVPAMVAGSIGGKLAGAAVGAIGGPETAAIGSTLGGGAGAMGLPEYIKQQHADEIEHGAYTSPEDFARRQAVIWSHTAQQAGIGAATFGVGEKVGVALKGLGVAAPLAFGMRSAAELGTMGAATYAMTGKLMSKEDLIDSAILMATFHGASALMGKDMPTVAAAKKNLSDNWVQTGEMPSDAAARAANDPVARQQFLTPSDVPRYTPPGSATHAASGYVLPRVPGTFEAAAQWMLGQEGGLTTDTGGVTKYGISSNAHPGLDVKNITPAQAVQLYHEEYWKPMGIDSLPANMKLPVFDAAINEGVGKAKELLAESGNDPQKFQELREEHYRSLAESDPGKYGKYLSTWLKRIGSPNAATLDANSGWDFAKSLNDNQAPSSDELKALSADQDSIPDFLARFAKDTSGAVGGLGPKVKPGSQGGSADPWEDVASRMADVAQPPKFSEVLAKTGMDVYREMAAPDEPVGRLTDAVLKGRGLPDADNPLYLSRVAETSDSRAQYMLERNMVDTAGNITGPGLKPILAPFENESGPHSFWTYAIARWAAEKATQAKDTGVDLHNAVTVIKDGHAKYGQAFKEMMDWQNGTISYLKDAGVISDIAHAEMIAENQARIPGYRDLGQEPKVGGAKGKTAYNPVKEMLGSDKQILNIQQSLMRDAFQRVQLANNNIFTRTVIDAGLTPEAKAAGVGVESSAGTAKDDITLYRDGVKESYTAEDPALAKYMNGLDKQTTGVWQRILGHIAGFQRQMIVLNPLFPVHILGYDLPFQFITKPGFRNTLADAYTGLREVFGDGTAYDEWMRKGNPDRVFEGLNRNAYMKEVLKGNADPSFLDGAFNVISKPVDMLRAWSMNMSQVMPVGRYANRDTGASDLKAGYMASEAPFHRSKFGGPAAKAINTTVPFFTAYINSLEKTTRSLIGVARPGEPEINPVHTWAKAAAVITLPILGTMALNHDKEWYKNVPDYIKDNALVMHFGDDWEATGQKDELGNPIMVPHGHTLVYKYPPILSALFGAIPRRLAEQFLNDNPDAWDDFSKSFGASFAPPGGMVYSAFLPILEHAANHSFFRDAPLVPDSVAHNLPTPEKYTPWSTSTAKMLSQFANDLPLVKHLGLSPPVIDNYIDSWAGTLGQAATHTVDAGLQALGMRQNAEAPHLEDTPLLSSWMVRYPGANAQPIRDFDAKWATFQGAHQQLALALRNQDFDAFQKVLTDNPEAAAMKLGGSRTAAMPPDIGRYAAAFGQAARSISPATLDWLKAAKALQNEEKLIKYVNSLPGRQNDQYPNAPWASPNDKRQLLDQHYATLQVMAERANELAKTAGIK